MFLVNRPCLITPGARRLAHQRDHTIEWVPTEGTLQNPGVILRDPFAGRLDSTLLAASATPHDVERLAREAAERGFACVCVNPVYVPVVSAVLKGTGVAVCTVVGFPLGASATTIKVMEARLAVEQGATEIDLVMSIGRAKAGDWDAVARDVNEVRDAVPSPGVTLKVIVESPLLTSDELDFASRTVVEAGADFVKTGTGTSGAVVPDDVRRIARAVGDQARIKAAGGIRDLETAMTLLDCGAHRLGTSTAGALLDEALRLAS